MLEGNLLKTLDEQLSLELKRIQIKMANTMKFFLLCGNIMFN